MSNFEQIKSRVLRLVKSESKVGPYLVKAFGIYGCWCKDCLGSTIYVTYNDLNKYL